MTSGLFSNPMTSVEKDKGFSKKPQLLGACEDDEPVCSMRNNVSAISRGEGFGFGGGAAPFSYMWYDNRLESYYNWPKSHPMRPESLAGAGLYYTEYSDKVRCFWCDTCLHQWEVFDAALEQHKKHSKGNCNFLRIFFPSK